ncbi:hypothetical protein TrST_g10795 [Triparma strigata]|uniref:Uncharacterized protein n=1 Tax=Triparma strigata TaxID=1606541 RepID=A0A9W7F2E8_9STRA|nr:hypothetical protein TrST_g10795 [Triparma strigata]
MIREEGAVLDVCFQLPFDEKLQGLKGKLYEKIKAHSKNERTFSLYWTTLGEYFVKDWGWNFEKRVGAGAAGKGVYIYGEVLDRILEVGGRDVMDLHEEFVMIMEEQFSCQTYIENIDTREGAEGEGDEGEGEEEGPLQGIRLPVKKRKLDGIKNGDGSAEKLEREKQSLAEFYAPALARLPGTLQIQPQIQNIIREYVEKNPHQFPSPDVEGGAEGGELPLQMTSHGLWLVTIAVKEYAKNILTKIVADEESGKVIHGEDVGRVVGRMKGEVGRVAWEMGLEDVKGSNDINK